MVDTVSPQQDMAHQLAGLGLKLPDAAASQVNALPVRTPIDGSLLALWPETSVAQVHDAVQRAQQALLSWRQQPAPLRGQVVRCFGEKVR